MIQHKVKLNSLLVAQPHCFCCMNVILYNSEDERVVCVLCVVQSSQSFDFLLTLSA